MINKSILYQFPCEFREEGLSSTLLIEGRVSEKIKGCITGLKIDELTKLSDIEPLLLKQMQSNVACQENKRNSTMKLCLEDDEASKRVYKNKGLITLVDEALSSIKPYINQSLFILTDSSAIAIYISGNKSVIEDKSLRIGSSFDINHAGINAISLAKQLNAFAYIKGKEHTLQCLTDWQCFCTPIQMGKRIMGYLNMSLNLQDRTELAAPLLLILQQNIQSRLLEQNPDTKKIKLNKLFDCYKLSNREKEVAFFWADHMTKQEIADRMFLSKETIRTHIKNIYGKMKVGEKKYFLEKMK